MKSGDCGMKLRDCGMASRTRTRSKNKDELRAQHTGMCTIISPILVFFRDASNKLFYSIIWLLCFRANNDLNKQLDYDDFLKHKQANINVKSPRFGVIVTPFSRQINIITKDYKFFKWHEYLCATRIRLND